jgi:hypothetical protein
MTITEQAAALAARLPPDTRDALDDLYDEDQRAEWQRRYFLSCARRRRTMIFLALREAGYSTSP